MTGKMVYDPLSDDPLAIPSYGDAPLYDRERLQRRVDTARDGRILCLAFHSVTDKEEWDIGGLGFERYMRILAEQYCNVISVRQLGEYIDPIKARSYTSEAL